MSLIGAASTGNVSEVCLLLASGNSDLLKETTLHGESALHKACAFNHAPVVSMLMGAGCDATLRDKVGNLDSGVVGSGELCCLLFSWFPLTALSHSKCQYPFNSSLGKHVCTLPLDSETMKQQAWCSSTPRRSRWLTNNVILMGKHVHTSVVMRSCLKDFYCLEPTLRRSIM